MNARTQQVFLRYSLSVLKRVRLLRMPDWSNTCSLRFWGLSQTYLALTKRPSERSHDHEKVSDSEKQQAKESIPIDFSNVYKKNESHQTNIEVELLFDTTGYKKWTNIKLTHGECPDLCVTGEIGGTGTKKTWAWCGTAGKCSSKSSLTSRVKSSSEGDDGSIIML